MAGVGNYATLQSEDTAEIKITSLTGSHIKGTFEFTAQTINNNKVIVSNGKFQYDNYSIQ